MRGLIDASSICSCAVPLTAHLRPRFSSYANGGLLSVLSIRHGNKFTRRFNSRIPLYVDAYSQYFLTKTVLARPIEV